MGVDIMSSLVKTESFLSLFEASMRYDQLVDNPIVVNLIGDVQNVAGRYIVDYVILSNEQ